MDDFARRVAEHGDDGEIGAILREVCDLTGMGFSAVARVTEDRWVACQVLDQIEFGMTPGSELEISTTICSEVRRSGDRVVIDHVDADEDWSTHPTPIMYGFKSYASLPVHLDDGSFYGTLCAIDPQPRRLSDPVIVKLLQALAARTGAILSTRITPADRQAAANTSARVDTL
jgi:GAF domain-containing protein